MKILNANLADALKTTVAGIKLGLYNANVEGSLSLDPEAEIDFTIEVVTASDFNTITRTQTTTPAADEVTTEVSDAYEETTVQTPATTQTDDSSLGGSDNTTQDYTYDEYSL